jgi:hypothetical protein
VTKALICVDKALPVSDNAHVFYFSATITSSIFLIATFVVYAIIPELRNTPGANLMCHVASTATAYTSVGIWSLNMLMLNKKACITLGNTF